MLTPDQVQPESLRPLKRSEYDRLIALGAFEDERVELLGGVIVRMSPQEAAHSFVIRRLHKIFIERLGERGEVQSQAPIAACGDSEPEPDLAVVPPGDYRAQHPSVAWLVVEVSESSLRKDRTVKAALYAKAGVAEYWIVNLVDRVVEVHTAPNETGYGARRVVEADGALTFERFPDVVVPVTQLLP